MSDLALSVILDRTGLGLSGLEVNDHVTFALATDFLGADIQWNRVQVSSPFNDSRTTTRRSLQIVQETITVEVFGDTSDDVATARQELVDAFSQSRYMMTVTVADVEHVYQCEAADFTMVMTGPRWIAGQLQVAFQVPRQPVPLVGSY